MDISNIFGKKGDNDNRLKYKECEKQNNQLKKELI